MSLLDTIGHALLDNSELHFDETPSGLSSSERWLVALSSPLSAFNGEYLDSLASRRDEQSLRKGVASMWNVHDRETFLYTARWLTEEGHRHAYAGLWKSLVSLDESIRATHPALRAVLSITFPGFYLAKLRAHCDYDALTRSSGKTLAQVSRIQAESQEWVGRIQPLYGIQPANVNSLLAWDVVRLVSLTRWAVELGYIDAAEFATYAGALTPQVRDTYAGWRPFGAAFFAGALLWSNSAARIENMVDTHRMLLTDRRSPYQTVHWAHP